MANINILKKSNFWKNWIKISVIPSMKFGLLKKYTNSGKIWIRKKKEKKLLLISFSSSFSGTYQ